MEMIDLRSDTVTLPTGAMREAMARAEVGDDVFGEDPTIHRLERMAAERTGKEAALFVPSGTMANLVCTLTQCARGEEVILGDRSHIFLNEAGGLSALGGLHPRILPNQADGTMGLVAIEAAIRGDNEHWPRTRLICLESTHNRCNGASLTAEYIESVADIARRHELKVHLDGARIFNAAVALGEDVKRFARHVDTLSFCLSKGLSAPVGSLACGTRAFIREARRTRKLLGGGMRQAGVIAAAGIVALEEMVDRIKEDHENARRLAEGVDRIQGLALDPAAVRTNILYFDLEDDSLTAEEFIDRLEERGVKAYRTGPKRFRMVTHWGIDRERIAAALRAMGEVMGAA